MNVQTAPALAPGATVGILGGGQLGRMMADAASRLGLRTHILAPSAGSVAAEVAGNFTCAEYHDNDALTAFATVCDVVTYEFENVPVGPLGLIADKVTLRPGHKALEVAQSRIDEKIFARDCGGRTAPFAVVNTVDDLEPALEKIGIPSILKTNRMGYDGKGQARLTGGENLREVWHSLGRQPAILEGFVQFEAEFSVILVRGIDGEIRYWDSTLNEHRDGILARSSLPAGAVIEAQVEEARVLAAEIAARLDYVGVLTCEFFASADGPVFNEMAPRVHNSGHWTIEGAVTSQFENHIRAIAGLPLGSTDRIADRVEMLNLIGDEASDLSRLLSDPRAHVHVYGKGQARPGRKMGHITYVDEG